MSTKVFYHVKDLDGHCSGALARYALEKQGIEPEMVPYNYGWPLPDLNPDDELYFVDISTDPYDVMLDLANNYKVTVMDHHKTFIAFLKEKDITLPGIQIEGTAGCELTWDFFFYDQPRPEFVTLLGRYDVWDHSSQDKWDTEIYPFQFGMKSCDTDPQRASSYLFWKDLLRNHFDIRDNKNINQLIANGHVILQYQKMEDASYSKMHAFEAQFEGHSAIVMNNPRGNSSVLDAVHDPDKHDLIVCFTYSRGRHWEFSFYAKPDAKIDVSKIARKYNGGGHAKAAGCIVEDFNFSNGILKLIKGR